MKNHFKINLGGMELSFLPPKDENDGSLISFRAPQSSHWLYIRPDEVVGLALLHRAIGEILDTYQPGIASPVPEGDSSEFDAIKSLFEVDRLWREGNRVEVPFEAEA